MGNQWEFAIDVGGTFTDCIGRSPDGSWHSFKLLSTGVFRGRVADGSTATDVIVHEHRDAPPDYFNGWTLRCAATGHQAIVSRFDSAHGRIVLNHPLTAAPQPGDLYELIGHEEAPVLGIRWLMNKSSTDPIGPCTIRLGTTRATNALLERRGSRVGFLTTAGFEDLLKIREQDRPKLFDLDIRKPEDLCWRVWPVQERLDAEGRVLIPLDEEACRQGLSHLRDEGCTSLAVCLLHAYRNPTHERQIDRIARELGFEYISLSSVVSPTQRIVPRAETTVVDAYVKPVLERYLEAIRRPLPEAKIFLMTSAGSLAAADAFFCKDLILSGPAGGVVGATSTARHAGFASAVAFDMGGTSTDVSRSAGEPTRRYQMNVRDPDTGGSVRVLGSMLAIETVAAGGGSVCAFNGRRITVGPASAGADPGPACYGRGGPLTITDCNLILGRLVPGTFSIPLNRHAAWDRIDLVRAEIESASAGSFSREELAQGFVDLANAHISSAIERIAHARGDDVRQDVFVSFGGAGGQHATAIARSLGIGQVLQHPLAGALSAYGIALADVCVYRHRHVGTPLDASNQQQQHEIFREIESEASHALDEEVGPAINRVVRRRVDLRYVGQEPCLTLDWTTDGLREEFESAHRKAYGFDFPGRAIEVLVARVEVAADRRQTLPTCLSSDFQEERPAQTETYFHGHWHRTPIIRRDRIQPDDIVAGPAIVVESMSTIVVEPGWIAKRNDQGDLILSDRESAPSNSSAPVAVATDAVTLALFRNRIAAIAEEMGVALERTAVSTNVKERRDYSCAIFTRRGELVVNAPHIPVHLGAMGATVRHLIESTPNINPGDWFITNDPFQGGSHLPDVTVVSPVFGSDASGPHFFVANRAHHAEIGGIVPGSMPPFSTRLDEEGVLIPLLRMQTDQEANEQRIRRLLVEHPYPTRRVEENLADIRAQSAANQCGVQALAALADEFSVDIVERFMKELRVSAANATRVALATLKPGTTSFRDHLDDGSPIVVSITIAEQDGLVQAVVDFAGTGPTTKNNLNANPAIVRSAVMYVLRTMMPDDATLNDGVLDPVTIRIPPGSLLDPSGANAGGPLPAVGGGNVETSQRIVDVLLGALGLAAGSQGTMNNLLFGPSATSRRPGFGYYETVAGGAGAGRGFAGASAVHTHMTNTRITDPEVFEDRYPVRLQRFAIRPASGGAGQFLGGDGVIREIEFLDGVHLSLVSGRRVTDPFGLEGGKPGQRGKNTLIRADGSRDDLGPFAQRELEPGDRILMETPGGGGFGAPPAGG